MEDSGQKTLTWLKKKKKQASKKENCLPKFLYMVKILFKKEKLLWAYLLYKESKRTFIKLRETIKTIKKEICVNVKEYFSL